MLGCVKSHLPELCKPLDASLPGEGPVMPPSTQMEYRAYRQWARNNLIAMSAIAFGILAVFFADVFSAITQLAGM